MTAADMTTQLLLEQRSFNHHPQEEQAASYDPIRTVRWAAAGLLLHGPYFYSTFRWLDRTFAASTSLRAVAKKTAAAQVIVFPPYLFLLFGFLGLLEGLRDVQSLWKHVWQRVPDAFAMGCVFWPLANMVNFSFVSSNLRVPYLASIGSVWNMLLSFLNNNKTGKGKRTAPVTK